jgi:hypothetical protein
MAIPPMNRSAVLRVARPTDNLGALSRMYIDGFGFEKLAAFENHRGFDGIILGHPQAPFHLEFTAQRDHSAGTAPDPDHLLVFYVPDVGEWERVCGRLERAGFAPVKSWNPYWDERGRTFEDIDGHRVVVQNDEWVI